MDLSRGGHLTHASVVACNLKFFVSAIVISVYATTRICIRTTMTYRSTNVSLWITLGLQELRCKWVDQTLQTRCTLSFCHHRIYFRLHEQHVVFLKQCWSRSLSGKSDGVY